MTANHQSLIRKKSSIRVLPGMETMISIDDIAEMMGISSTRVWQLEVRAVKKIRAGLMADPVIRQYVREEINPNA